MDVDWNVCAREKFGGVGSPAAAMGSGGFGAGETWMEKAIVWAVVASLCVLNRFA